MQRRPSATTHLTPGVTIAPILPRAGRRHAILSYSINLLLLLWPVAVNSGPFYVEDSTSYLRGGDLGFHTGLLILSRWWQSLFGTPSMAYVGTDPHAVVKTLIAQSGGVRSLIYSIVTYVLRGPHDSLVPLVIAQAAAV